MFDPHYCAGDVETLRGPKHLVLEPDVKRMYAVHVLAGTAYFNSDMQLQTGDTLLLDSMPGGLNLGKDVAALVIKVALTRQIDASKLVIATR